MRFLLNGNAVAVNGWCPEYKSGSLVFQVSGTHFPYSYFEPPSPNTAAFNNTNIAFISSAPQRATINYGDGSIITYDSVLVGGVHRITFVTSVPSGDSLRQPIHTYTDGNSGDRSISIVFSDPDKVIQIASINSVIKGVFPSEITTLSSLNTLSISRADLTQFPVTMSTLSSLRSLTLALIGTAISERIPNEFLSLHLEIMDIGGSIVLTDIETSNFAALCESVLTDTLKHLVIDDTFISTLPVTISNFTILESLFIGSRCLFTTVPPEVNTIPSLKRLHVGGNKNANPTVLHHNDISNLVNLNTYEAPASVNLETALPSGMDSCTLLKTYNVNGTYKTTSRIDAFINTMYDFVVANAAISGSSTLPFRGMTVSTHLASLTGGVPTGTYQQPSGYVAGVSNGDPVSPREKIWLLVNQYGHTWTYKT